MKRCTCTREEKCAYCEGDDNWCDKCEAPNFDGCIHYSPCCEADIIEGTDCCSDCKEHTGIDNH